MRSGTFEHGGVALHYRDDAKGDVLVWIGKAPGEGAVDFFLRGPNLIPVGVPPEYNAAARALREAIFTPPARGES